MVIVTQRAYFLNIFFCGVISESKFGPPFLSATKAETATYSPNTFLPPGPTIALLNYVIPL